MGRLDYMTESGRWLVWPVSGKLQLPLQLTNTRKVAEAVFVAAWKAGRREREREREVREVDVGFLGPRSPLG